VGGECVVCYWERSHPLDARQKWQLSRRSGVRGGSSNRDY
jgi:hypothetical protein